MPGEGSSDSSDNGTTPVVGSDQQQHAPIAGPLASGTTPSLTLARSLNCEPDALMTMPPFDLFVAQFSSDSTEARVDAMKKLAIVGEAMGPEGALNKLIPYLTEHIANADKDDDDEILLILAGQLALMVPGLVPGHAAMPLLPILERLCSIEETVVRDKAVETTNKVVPLLMPGGNYEDGAPFGILLAQVKRLAAADWFTAKVSAAGVLPATYAFYHAHASKGENDAAAKQELRILFKDLSEDDTPMVRRSAAKHLGKFVEAVAGLTEKAENLVKSGIAQPAIEDENKRMVTYELVPIFQALSSDEQDSVRLLAVKCAGSMGCGLAREPAVTAEVVLPVVRGGCLICHGESDTIWLKSSPPSPARLVLLSPNMPPVKRRYSSSLLDYSRTTRPRSVRPLSKILREWPSSGGPSYLKRTSPPSSLPLRTISSWRSVQN